MKQTTNKELLTIALKLLVICSVVALIVAFVNSITKDRIAYNQLINTAEALNGIYSEQYDGNKFEISTDGAAAFIMHDKNGNNIASCEIADTELLTDMTALYVIKNSDGNTDGYCVAASPMGFKDKINMLVAINPNVTVKSIKIVSLSETLGIGTKIMNQDFLNPFVGLSSPVSASVDTISGATKSSAPVIGAVDTALQQAANYITQSGGAVNE